MKRYIKPELETTEVKLQKMIAISIPTTTEEAADPNYEGGGDAKVVNFATDGNYDF